jgi:hypothetical protein
MAHTVRKWTNGHYDDRTGHSRASRTNVNEAWVEKSFGKSDVLTIRDLPAALHNNEEVEIVLREWLRMPEPDIHHDGIFKLVP